MSSVMTNYTVISHLGKLYEGCCLDTTKMTVISCLEVESCFGYSRWETGGRKILDIYEHGIYMDEGWWDVQDTKLPIKNKNWHCVCWEDITKFVEIREEDE